MEFKLTISFLLDTPLRFCACGMPIVVVVEAPNLPSHFILSINYMINDLVVVGF